MSIPASTARANLFSLIKQVNEDQEAVLVTSNAGNAVLVSESEWENMLETVYLYSIIQPSGHRSCLMTCCPERGSRSALVPLCRVGGGAFFGGDATRELPASPFFQPG